MTVVISSDFFTVNAKSMIMSAESSDLRGYPFGDEVDILSMKTQNVERFVLTSVVRDAENELIAWIFKPKNPALYGWQLRVYND